MWPIGSSGARWPSGQPSKGTTLTRGLPGTLHLLFWIELWMRGKTSLQAQRSPVAFFSQALKTSITWMTENLHRLSTSVAFQGDILKSLFVKHFIQLSYSLCAVLCPFVSHLCSISSFVIPVFIPPEQHSANIKLLNCFCVFQHNSSVRFSCLLLIFSSC